MVMGDKVIFLQNVNDKIMEKYEKIGLIGDNEAWEWCVLYKNV